MPKTPKNKPENHKQQTHIFKNPESLETYINALTEDFNEIDTQIQEGYHDVLEHQKTFPELERLPKPLNLNKLIPAPTKHLFQKKTVEKAPLPNIQKEPLKEPSPPPTASPQKTTQKPPPATSPSIKTEPIKIPTQKKEPILPKKVDYKKEEKTTKKKKGILLNNFLKEKKESSKKTAPHTDKKSFPPPPHTQTPKKLTTYTNLEQKRKDREQRLRDLLDKNSGGTAI